MFGRRPAILFVIVFLIGLYDVSAFATGQPGASAPPVGHPVKTLSQLGLLPGEIISIQQLKNKITRGDQFVLFDARGKQSYDEGHIRGAVLPLSEDYYRAEQLFRNGLTPNYPDRDKALAERIARYPKDLPIVTYCSDGCQASVVMFFSLKRLGYKYVKVMDGGFETWEKKGYPVTGSTGDQKI